MKIKNITFNRWILNHPVGHNAIWFRECMPWAVFREVNFCPDMINVNQEIYINDELYYVVVTSLIKQENDRILSVIKITYIGQYVPISEYAWDTLFSIIFDPDTFEFITAFPAKDHPLKGSVKKFMSRKFENISSNERSRLLYARTLMTFVTDQLYPELNYLRRYALIHNKEGLKSPKKGLAPPSRPAIPMFSNDRKFWLHFCWDEDTAHRFGLLYKTQCDRMLIIFAKPVYSRHHRCHNRGVEIISLSEYVDRLKQPLRAAFDLQLWFIREGSLPNFNQENIWTPDKKIQEIIPIKNEELREALSVRELSVIDEHDAAYVLACYNLINAWVSRVKDNKAFRDQEGLFKELYSFKSRLSASLSRIILSKVAGIKIYIDNSSTKNTTYIKVKNVQFSFHYITIKNIMIVYEKSKPNALPIKGDYLEEYLKSPDNIFQEWTGFRLQPIASLVLAWARRERRTHAIEQLG